MTASCSVLPLLTCTVAPGARSRAQRKLVPDRQAHISLHYYRLALEIVVSSSRLTEMVLSCYRFPFACAALHCPRPLSRYAVLYAMFCFTAYIKCVGFHLLMHSCCTSTKLVVGPRLGSQPAAGIAVVALASQLAAKLSWLTHDSIILGEQCTCPFQRMLQWSTSVVLPFVVSPGL